MVRACGDGLRVIADPSNETRVEAIGFGAILAAYANDKETFDGLMRFYDSKRTVVANEMMAWLVTCETVEDPGSATDGDIDVAFANIVAHTQWGGDYLNKAIEIINIISGNLITDCTVNGATCKVLYPGFSGVAWGGCQMTDIQYYTPAFFRVFARVTGDDVWNQLADDSYKILNASANPSTGLVPDWQTAEGVPGPGSRAGHYGYDACRVPWRMSLDYLWNGNSKAGQWCTKISNWAYEVGASNIVDGYELDGSAIGNNGLNSAFLGGFTVAMMTSDYEKVTDFSETFGGLNDSYWFNLNTRVLYLFALTGNFWEPQV
jgi:endo-1,4-beta-D-glucanase Y